MRSITSNDTTAYEEEKSVTWSIGRATITPTIHGKKKITWSMPKKHSKNTSNSTRSHDPLLNAAFIFGQPWTLITPSLTSFQNLPERSKQEQTSKPSTYKKIEPSSKDNGIQLYDYHSNAFSQPRHLCSSFSSLWQPFQQRPVRPHKSHV